ncbi:unnamed protein product, partial [Coregonus sp. 'balchen']
TITNPGRSTPSSWILLLSTGVGVLFVFDPLGSRRPGPQSQEQLGVRDLESSEGSQLLSTTRSVAVRVWESRLRLLCCCLPQDESHRVAFSSRAQLVSGLFSDTDLVPSDIAAGLALLHQEQDKREQCRDPDEVLPHSPSSPIAEELEAELEKAADCMQFAIAAYGWPMYVYSNPLTGACKLSGDCCKTQSAEYDIVGGDNMGCHFSSILHNTGLQYRDFIYVSFHNQIYEIPFFVALDHKSEAVLVAVRGTLSLRDLLTDLSANCENLPVEGTCYAHKGMSQAACYIYKKLLKDGILNQAFTIAPCYTLSPPGGLMRLSYPNMEDLKRRILKMVSNCNKPKYRILLQGCWYELFGGDPDDFPTEMDNRREEELIQPLLGEETLLIHGSSSYQSLASEDSPVHCAHLPLYLPGRILHITEDGPSRRSCFSQVHYRAEWSSETAFRSVLISPRMIADHMPDAVLRSLHSLTQDFQPLPLVA